MKRSIYAAIILNFSISMAYADTPLDEGVVSNLKTVPMVDVLECHAGDEKSLSGFLSVAQMGGEKLDKKGLATKAEFEERISYWSAIIADSTEEEIADGQLALEDRQEARRQKLESMSMVERSVYLAKREYPCDDIFKSASK